MSKSAVVLRTGFPFNYDQEAASLESGLRCKDKSLTLQSQSEDADINVIVKRFGVTGQLPNVREGLSFANFEGIFDFRSAMDAVRDAQVAFGALDADLRLRFANDPQRFLEFCEDPRNQDELVKLGLAVARPDADADLVKEVEREAKKDKIRAKSAGAGDGGSAAAGDAARAPAGKKGA